jgi:hypothetical protein
MSIKHHKSFLLLIVLLLIGTAMRSDNENLIWETLFSVKYNNWRDNYQPVFNEKIKALDGKNIRVRGFLIPLEEKSKHTFFLLSAFPYDACFYCGKAGPETVIEVSTKTPLKYTEKPITISGTLKLNYNNPERLFYIIDDGVLAKP